MPYDRAGYRDHCRECRHFGLDAWLMQIRRYAYGVDAPAAYYCDALRDYTYYCDALRDYVNASDSPQNPLSVAAGCVHYEKANGVDNEPNPKEN